MSRVTSHIRFILCSMFILCLGCAGSALTSRVVQEDPSWFVRLDSYQDAGRSSGRYDHPAIWTTDDLFLILSRLLLEERVGLMDSVRPPKPVFSAEEITLLLPAIRDAFERATPREWISFALFPPSSSGLAVTSGGMFLADGRLHVVVANHHTSLARDSEEVSHVRANPFLSAKGSGGVLTFESARFVRGTQANWWGGNNISASELILDHRAFLAFPKSPTAISPAASSGPVSTSPLNSQPGSPTKETTDTHSALSRLQEEVERLKKKVEEQEREILRLKRATDPSFR